MAQGAAFIINLGLTDMIGRFILLCDTEHFDVAREAAVYLMEHPEHKEAVISQSDGSGAPASVAMFVKRLKKSITVRQIRP